MAGSGLALIVGSLLFPKFRHTARLGWAGLFLSGITLNWNTWKLELPESEWLLTEPAGLTLMWGGWFLCILCYALLWPILKAEENPSTLPGYLLTAFSGLLLLTVANDLLLMTLGLETISICLLFLIWQDRTLADSLTTGLTYFRLSVFTLVLFLFGVSFLYGLTGSTSLDELNAFARTPDASVLWASEDSGFSPLGILGLVLTIAGLGFRAGLIPFQFGLSELNEKLGFSRTGYLLLLMRAAGFLVLIRVLNSALLDYGDIAQPLLLVVAGATLGIASTLAVAEKHLHRQINYLLLAQGGIVLGCLAVTYWESSFPAQTVAVTQIQRDMIIKPMPTAFGLSAYTLAIHLLSITGLLSTLAYFQPPEEPRLSTDDLRGAFHSDPMQTLALGLFLLNLCGIPPLPGFWSRLLTLLSLLSVHYEAGNGAVPVMHLGFVILAGLVLYSMLITTIITMRHFSNLFLEKQTAEPNVQKSAMGSGLIYALAFILSGLSLLPAPLLVHLQQTLK